MVPLLKPFHCPSCKLCFTSRDTARISNISRFPLILKCGHTLCENCIRNSVKTEQHITCSVCKIRVECKDEDVSHFPPDVYVLGIVAANMKQTFPSVKMKPVRSISTEKRSEEKDAFVMCDSCSAKEASFRCEKCEENFCNTCFDIIHKDRGKSLQKHVGIPVYSNVYRTMVQSGCPQHENRAIEFFCEEDNNLVCSLCVVTGDHKGHLVLTLSDKNKACAEDLQKSCKRASQINKRLRFTEYKLSQAIPNETVDNSHLVKEIHSHFHALHTALILRENELIAQVESISQANSVHLEKLRQEVSDSYKDFDSVLRDAELVLQNPAVSISVPALIKKLESVEGVPCHLLPIDDNSDTCETSLTFEPNMHAAIMQYGKVSADTKLKFCLKSFEELPDNFIADPIPEESTPVEDSESTVSDTYSEDSLNSSINHSTFSLPLHMDYYASKQVKVHVTFIQDPTSFYVIRSSEFKRLKILSDKINKWCKSPEAKKHTPTTVKEGDLYLVCYAEDNKWYRARVLSLECKKHPPIENSVPSDVEVITESRSNPEQMAKIIYIDFGNSEVVPVSRLREMQSQFLNISGLAKKCSLHDIIPMDGKWSISSVNTFRDFVHEKEVNMMVMEEREGVLYVDLSQAAVSDVTNDVPVSVRDALVFLEHGTFIAENKTIKSAKHRRIKKFYPPEEIRANVKTNVLVSHVESPSRFYVQQLGTSRHLSDLILEMKKFYEDETNILHTVYVPYIGMMCAAKYSKDGFWYRAEVIGLPGGAKVEVLYIDFGNRETVHHRFIRKLMDRYAKLSTQAVLCCLADLSCKGNAWSPEAASWFSSYVEKKHLTLLSLGMIPSKKVTKSVLYHSEYINCEVCINALMVSFGYAASTGPHSRVVKLDKFSEKPTMSPDKSAHTSSKQSSQKQMDEISIPQSSSSKPAPSADISELGDSLVAKNEPENHVKVLVSYIESPGQFYSRIADETEEGFRRLMKSLQEDYKDSDDPPSTIVTGNNYAVFRLSDKMWYRGNVQDKTDDQYQVRFVDIGFTEIVPAKNFRVLLKQHSIDEAFCVECYLAGIQPAGGSNKWPLVAIDTFKELVSAHEVLYLIGEGKVEHGSLPSDLLYKEIIRGGALEPSKVLFRSIRQHLLDKGLALRIRIIKTPTSETQPVTASISPSSTCSSLRSVCGSPCTVINQPTAPMVHSKFDSEEQDVMNLVIPRSLSPRLPAFRWLPPVVPSKTKFLCRPSHVADDGCIFLQPKPDNTSKADLITKAFQCKYKECPPEMLRIPPPVGEAVVAKFVLDKKWYRAEIFSDDPNKIKVQFVDFGNYEIVELDDIRLDISMKDTPRLALEAELFDAKPATGSTWPDEILSFVHETIVDEDCICEIMVPPEEGKRLQVSLTLDEQQTNIASLLKDIGKAVSLPEYEQRMENEKVISFPVENSREIGYCAPRSLRLTDPFRVCITQPLEPNVVYLQRLNVENPATKEEEAHNEDIDQFLQMMKELTLNAETFPAVTDPKQGLACCAKYTYDNNWYRCEITEVTSKGVYVHYIDYGNSEVLPLDRLRKPDPKFLKFPARAHLCKIHGLQPVGEDWSVEATKALLERFLSGSELYAKIVVFGKVNEIDVLMKTESGELDLAYKDLIEDGLVSCYRH